MSNSLLCGHLHAVRFNYPAELLASDKGLIASYTVNMANAITPSALGRQFAALLGTGIRGKGVHELAEEVLGLLDSLKGVTERSQDPRTHIAGIGGAKAGAVCAALELGRRL